jgi:hypothetical protein
MQSTCSKAFQGRSVLRVGSLGSYLTGLCVDHPLLVGPAEAERLRLDRLRAMLREPGRT